MNKPVPDNGHSEAMKTANERPMKKSDDPADNVSGGFNQKAGRPAPKPDIKSTGHGNRARRAAFSTRTGA